MRIAKSRLVSLALVLSAALLLDGCGSSPQSQLQKAREYAAAGKDRAALVELRNLVKKHPDNRQGRLALGTILLNVGDPAAAAVQLEQAQKLGAKPENVELPLAQALIQTGKFKEALSVLHPDKASSAKLQAAILTSRGEAEIGLKQLQNANKSFAAALDKNPRYARAVAGQAGLALINKETSKAITKADQALALDTKSGQALAVKGMALLAEARFPEASKALQQALTIGPPQLSPRQLFMLRGRLAQTQLAAGQRDQALKNLELMLKQAPKQPYANYLRGLLAYQEKDYSTAVQHLQTALNANPYDARALTLLGAAEAAQNHDVLAANYLSSALARSPDNPMARHMLASLQIRSGQSQTAVDTLIAGGNVSSNAILSLFKSPTDAIKTLTALQGKVQSDTHRAAIDLALAQAFLLQGNSKGALSTLGQVKGNGANALNAQRLTAAAFIRDGQPDKAIKIAESIAAKHGNNASALQLASAIMLAAGSNRGAESMLRKAERIAPANPGTTNALGALMLREGRLAEAQSAFENTLRHAPQNLSAQIALARIAAQRGQVGEATRWLDKARAGHPKSLAPLVVLTRYQLQQHKTKLAVETAQQAIKLAPKAPAILALLGRAQLADGQNAAALKTFQAAAAASPNDPRYGLNVAATQLTLQKPKEAQTTLARIVEKHPAFVPAVRALAMTQLQNNDAQAAFKTVDKLAQERNGKAAAEAIRGDLYNQQKHYAEARSAYLRAQQLAPSRTLALKAFAAGVRSHAKDVTVPLQTWLKTHPHDAIARSNLASYFQSTGRLREAETEYREALRYSPDNAVILNNLAYLVGAKDIAKALPLAEKAHQAAPKSPQIMDTYGWLLTRNKQPEKALPLLQKAASELKNTPQVEYHYAKVLADVGKRSEAAALLQTTLKKHAKFEDRVAAENLLKQLENGQ